MTNREANTSTLPSAAGPGTQLPLCRRLQTYLLRFYGGQTFGFYLGTLGALLTINLLSSEISAALASPHSLGLCNVPLLLGYLCYLYQFCEIAVFWSRWQWGFVEEAQGRAWPDVCALMALILKLHAMLGVDYTEVVEAEECAEIEGPDEDADPYPPLGIPAWMRNRRAGWVLCGGRLWDLTLNRMAVWEEVGGWGYQVLGWAIEVGLILGILVFWERVCEMEESSVEERKRRGAVLGIWGPVFVRKDE